MSTDLLDIPSSQAEIPVLPVRVKPDWVGWGRPVGAGLWLLEHLTQVCLAASLVGLVGLWVHPLLPLGVAGGVVVALTLLLAHYDVDRWATRLLDVYVQAIGGVIYVQRGRDLAAHPLSAASRGHEGLHDWQFRQLGALRFLWRYYATRKGRRHAEAMAYGYEVAVHAAELLDVAEKAADPTYGMAWTVDQAAELIGAYAERFREEWKL